MPSTFTPNKIFELQATGENLNTWGTKNNTDYSIIDLNLGGRLNLSVAGAANVVLTTTQARNVYHNLTGLLTGNIDYQFPTTNGGFYFIKNATTGAFTLTVKPTGGTGIAIPQGQTIAIFIDPDQTAAVVAAQPLIVSGGGLEFSTGALERSALTGDVTASAGSNATVLGITTTRGDIIVRGASVNGRLAIGAANTMLVTDGTDPLWRTLTAQIDAALGSTQGQVLYRGASAWLALGVGTNGQFLQTQGAAANPQWATVSAGAVAASQAEQEAGSSTTVYTSPGRQQFHPSAAKCWAYVTVSAGTPTLAASYNITSITDTGTGILTITIATDFSSTSWGAVCSIERATTTFGNNANWRSGTIRLGTIAAGSIALDCADGNYVAADPTSWHFTGYGDQA